MVWKFQVFSLIIVTFTIYLFFHGVSRIYDSEVLEVLQIKYN